MAAGPLLRGLLHEMRQLRQSSRVIASRTRRFGARAAPPRRGRATRPAQARLSIAAGPMSSKLSIRNSSPKPSSRFSSSASMASNVESREVMPVPPVVMITWASPASCARRNAVTSAGSSRTMARATTWWPSASSRSAMARPLRVGVRGAGVADGQHGHADDARRLGLVSVLGHGGIIEQRLAARVARGLRRGTAGEPARRRYDARVRQVLALLALAALWLGAVHLAGARGGGAGPRVAGAAHGDGRRSPRRQRRRRSLPPSTRPPRAGSRPRSRD